MNVFHACARKRLFPGNLRCGRVCADRSPSCSSGTAPSTGAAEGRHRWPRPFGSTTESRSSWPVRAAGRGRRSNRTCCPYRSTGASQSRSAVNGCSRTRGTRAIPMFEPGYPRHAADSQSLLHGEPTTLRSTISVTRGNTKILRAQCGTIPDSSGEQMTGGQNDIPPCLRHTALLLERWDFWGC